jgi:integrase
MGAFCELDTASPPAVHSAQSRLSAGSPAVEDAGLQRPPTCPECGSVKVWKDGLRIYGGEVIQRWLCRSCGYRFSEHSLINKKENRQTLGYQVCADGKEAKNLVTVETRTQEKAAGATSDMFNFAWELKKIGLKESTIQTYTYCLLLLKKREADLLDPESVKGVIARQTWSENTKSLAVKAYNRYLKIHGGEWIQPKVRYERKLPFIPQERELDQLIGGAYRLLATFLQLLKETGVRSGEAWHLEWTDIDFEAGAIILNRPEKHGKPRMLKISPTLISMLNSLQRKADRIFPMSLNAFGRTFRRYRMRMTEKLQNPRLNRITFHTFRHWKATMEYHRTKDILHVMEMLGHRDIKNTLIYTQLVSFEGNEYHVKASKTLEEDEELLKAGFEYVTERDNVKIYRRRK